MNSTETGSDPVRTVGLYSTQMRGLLSASAGAPAPNLRRFTCRTPSTLPTGCTPARSRRPPSAGPRVKAVGGLATLGTRPRSPLRTHCPFGEGRHSLDSDAPVAKFVGTRREIADYVGHTRRDWSELRTRFQDGIALKFAQAEPSVAPEPTVVPVVTVVPKAKPRAKTAKAADA